MSEAPTASKSTPAQSDELLAPWDEHNQRLAALVHPADWTNPTPEGRYNLVVIGGGTAGLVTAIAAAGLGAKVAMIERHMLGGDCLNMGCVPSKALIRAARAAADARRGSEFGVQVAEPVVDFGAVMDRMRRLRAHIAENDSAKRFSEAGVDVYIGEGRFIDGQSISVSGQTLGFKKAVIATGARAFVPPIPGLHEVGFLTNETVFSLTELPRRLAVVGAGAIGCELAQTFARFGTEVTLVELADRIMPREDADASRVVAASLERDGVTIHVGAKLAEVKGNPDHHLLILEVGEHTEALPVDHILVAIGRAPNVDGVGLEDAGVEFGRRGVVVDDFMRTTNKRIFAAGDVASRHQFTHAADFMARLVIRNALFAGRGRHSALVVPHATYTDPEVAHVGITVEEAKERGVTLRTFTQEFEHVDRAILEGETEGFARIHVAADSDRILGATVVASHAGEMINEVTVAMKAGMGLGELANVIHPYPTQAEALRKLGDQYNRTRLTPFVAKAMKKLLAWTR